MAEQNKFTTLAPSKWHLLLVFHFTSFPVGHKISPPSLKSLNISFQMICDVKCRPLRTLQQDTGTVRPVVIHSPVSQCKGQVQYLIQKNNIFSNQLCKELDKFYGPTLFLF